MYPLGKFSLRVSIGGIVSGIAVFIAILSNITIKGMDLYSPVNIFTMVGYIVGISIIFILPLMAATKCMRLAKQQGASSN